MSATVADLFNELLFGSGFWIGFILIVVFAVATSYKFKYTGLIFEIILFMMSLEYIENLEVNSNYMWGVILCYVVMIFLVVQLYNDFKN